MGFIARARWAMTSAGSIALSGLSAGAALRYNVGVVKAPKAFLILVLLLLGLRAGAESAPRIIPLRSDVYNLMRGLYVESRLSLPSQGLPWSVDELRRHLDRVPRQRLSPAGRAAYDRIEAELATEPGYSEEGGVFTFDTSVTMSLEGALRFGTGEVPAVDPGEDLLFPDQEIWEHGADDRLPLMLAPLELGLFDRVHVDLELELREDPKTAGTDPDNRSNLYADPYDVYLHFPFRAYVAAGGEHWTVQMGRETLSWGPGVTGNLLLSDYADYHDVLRATTYWRTFKFTAAYIALEPWLTAAERADFPDDERYKAFFGHRFEFRIRDIASVALTESIIYGRKYPDLSFLNPVMVFHNFYQNKVTNVLATLEAEATPIRGLAVYGSFAAYQWQTPLEEATFAGADAEPDAFGYLLGAEWLRGAGPGWIQAGFEWVHTNPWMYTLRWRSPLLSFTSRRDVTARSGYFLDRPLGYLRGPDSDVKQLRVGYLVPGRWEAQVVVERRLKGELAINDPYPDDSAYVPPPELTEQYADPNGQRTPTGEHPERTWVLGAAGSVRWRPFLQVGGSAAWVHTRNPGAVAGGPTDDAEITAFLTVSW